MRQGERTCDEDDGDEVMHRFDVSAVSGSLIFLMRERYQGN